MSTIASQAATFQLPGVALQRFTVEQYQRMIGAGVFGEDDPVELIEGWIVRKMPKNPPHELALDSAQDALRPLLPPAWRLRVQQSVTLDTSQAEPGLSVVRNPKERYAARHPGPEDIGLIVEISASSLATDRDVKAPAYARAGIPHYWIVNLVDGWVELHSDPTAESYATRQTLRGDDELPLLLDGIEIARLRAGDLLPPA